MVVGSDSDLCEAGDIYFYTVFKKNTFFKGYKVSYTYPRVNRSVEVRLSVTKSRFGCGKGGGNISIIFCGGTMP